MSATKEPPPPPKALPYLLDAIWAWKEARSKIREEWKLGAITEEQLAEVLALMLRGMSYKNAAAFCDAEFGVSIKPGNLHEFYKQVGSFVLSSRRRAAVQGANTIGAEVTSQPAENFDAAIVDLIKQTAFEVLSNPEPSEKQLNTMINAVLKLRDQSAVDRRIALLEMQAAEATATVNDSKLSAAQQAERLREIFKK